MSSFRILMERLGIDRAVSYAMATRLWQIPSGAITTLLIAVCFAADQQGIYYLILTLTGLQALADAGLINTLLHAASHDSAHGRLDDRGFFRSDRRARRRLSGLVRFGAVWFSIAAAVLVVVATAVGTLLLARQDVIAQSIGPLVVAVLLSGLTLALSPVVAILEGCNQVHTVNRYRFGQAITGSLVVWVCLASGAGLWTAAAAIAVQLVWEARLLLVRYRRFIIQLIRRPAAEFDWRREIWPLQWRIGIQSVFQFLAFLPIVPVLFDTQGPEIAGRYGMTWQVMNSLLMVAYVYLRTRSPDFGRLIAEKRREESNTTFQNVVLGSTALLAGLLCCFCCGLFVLGNLDWEFTRRVAGRFLPLSTCLWFAAALLPIHLMQCFAMYIRSQRFDPIWRVSIPCHLTLGILAYLSASQGEIEWIAYSMLVVFVPSSLTLYWMCRWYDRHFRSLESATPAS